MFVAVHNCIEAHGLQKRFTTQRLQDTCTLPNYRESEHAALLYTFMPNRHRQMHTFSQINVHPLSHKDRS